MWNGPGKESTVNIPRGTQYHQLALKCYRQWIGNIIVHSPAWKNAKLLICSKKAHPTLGSKVMVQHGSRKERHIYEAKVIHRPLFIGNCSFELFETGYFCECCGWLLILKQGMMWQMGPRPTLGHIESLIRIRSYESQGSWFSWNSYGHNLIQTSHYFFC